jgi:hypothetical protein
MPQRNDGWTRATLGSAARGGNSITVWCNNRACGYELEHGKPYRAVLTVVDLALYAEKYGADVTFIDFRARLRCKHCGSGDVSTVVDSHNSPEDRWKREAREAGDDSGSRR